jgi:hypothetical protein
MYGSDTEFCAWMRACRELPSYGDDFGFVASDNDITIHRYMTAVDGLGTRDLQSIMQIEIKTRIGKPPPSQLDTLSKLNSFAGIKKSNGQVVVFYGVFLLVLEGTNPDDSENMWWGILPKDSFTTNVRDCKWRRILRDELISILRFERNPRTWEKPIHRRHHKTEQIMVVERMPLGFDVPTLLVRRS